MTTTTNAPVIGSTWTLVQVLHTRNGIETHVRTVRIVEVSGEGMGEGIVRIEYIDYDPTHPRYTGRMGYALFTDLTAVSA